MNFFYVTVGGNLTMDPKMSVSGTGTTMCRGSIAVNPPGQVGKGDSQAVPAFLSYRMWGNAAEAFGKYAKKGDPFVLFGRMALTEWTDERTGKTVQRWLISVDHWSFLSPPPKSDYRSGEDRKASARKSGGSLDPTDDTLPF